MNRDNDFGKNKTTGVKRLRELATFGLRKAFVTTAPKPIHTNVRMRRFFGASVPSANNWLPE